MRKLLILFLVTLISFSAIKPQEARAELPVKARAFLTMVGYGTASGALLGVASLAFGSSTRAVAQGASLGLYAGIIFGSYILFSHHQRHAGSYEDNSSPYQEASDVYGDEYQGDEGGSKDGEEDSRGGFFDRFQLLKEKYHTQAFTFQSDKQRGSRLPPLQVNLFQMNF
ncbi:MAG TPA: hypothetical protein VNJ01_02300 [Bacteriovoracaceae bacterium]|nr:hypothetical protein [Bacteriovoracaceae bacterium]